MLSGRGCAGANAVLMDAFDTDVRPLLREVREEMGLDADPMAAYARSGWAEKIVAERVGGEQAGWGREVPLRHGVRVRNGRARSSPRP